MRLNKRLQTIASLVEKNKNVIDIGCDHGLLDIYLTLCNNNNCIASDINANALKSAINNIKKYNLTDKIETIISDGFDNINILENTTAIIAGMGTINILKILQNNKLKNIDNLLIQTNTDIELFRRKIVKLNYMITDEYVVYDKKIYYVIMNIKKGKVKYSNKEYSLGPILLSKKDEEVLDYYKHLYKVNYNIYNSLSLKNKLKKFHICLLIKWLKKEI